MANTLQNNLTAMAAGMAEPIVGLSARQAQPESAAAAIEASLHRPRVRSCLVWIVLCCAAFVIYSHLWAKAPFADADTRSYTEMVPDIAHFHLTKLYGRTPGLPAVFAIVGTGRAFFLCALLMHLIGVSAMLVVLFRLGVRTSLLWTFGVLALLPPYVQNVVYLLSESIAAPFLMLGFVSLCFVVFGRSWIHGLLASFWFAWAALARPTNAITPFLLAFLLVVMLGKKMIRPALALVSVSVLLLGSYIGYTGAKFHYFGLSYLTGYHLTCTTVNLYDDIDNPIARGVLLKARTDMYRQGLPPIDGVWLWRDKLKEALGLSDLQLGNFLLKMNLKLITHHPEAYLEDSARSMVGYWFPYVTKYAVGNSRTGAILKNAWDAIEDLASATFLLEVVLLSGLAIGLKMFGEKNPFRGGRAVVLVLAAAVIFQTQIISCLMVGGEIPRYRSVTDILILFSIILASDWIWATARAARQGSTLS
jgi:hypothetical protein